ncbi:MAG: hypothetical protein ACLQOO_26835 [Terriglobia bacterium]
MKVRGPNFIAGRSRRTKARTAGRSIDTRRCWLMTTSSPGIRSSKFESRRRTSEFETGSDTQRHKSMLETSKHVILSEAKNRSSYVEMKTKSDSSLRSR